MLKTMIQRIYLMKRCLISNIAIIIGRSVFYLFVNISKKVYSWSGSSKISLYFHYIMFVLLWKYHGVCFVGHHCGKRHSIVEKIILKKTPNNAINGYPFVCISPAKSTEIITKLFWFIRSKTKHNSNYSIFIINGRKCWFKETNLTINNKQTLLVKS